MHASHFASISYPKAATGMQTTPLPPLSWGKPGLRVLAKQYSALKASGEKPRLPCSHRELQGAFVNFYRDNGYLGKPAPREDKLIDNPIHPIFNKENFMVNQVDFDKWYGEVTPALRLVSKLITAPHMLSWWLTSIPAWRDTLRNEKLRTLPSITNSATL